MENIKVDDINRFFGGICQLCKDYVVQRLNEANWQTQTQFESPSDPKSVCSMCQLNNLGGDLLVFDDLKFVPLIDANSEIQLENFSFPEFDLNRLLKSFKTSPEIQSTTLQNELFDSSDSSFSDSKVVPLAFDFFVISNYVKNPKNHNNFKNLVQFKFNHSVPNNTYLFSNNCNIVQNNDNNNTNDNGDCKIDNNSNDSGVRVNKADDNNGSNVVKINGREVIMDNLRNIILGLFLRESDRVAQSRVASLFSQICEDKLLLEQLVRIKINVNFEPNFQNRGNNFLCTLRLTRDVVTFTGYYNKYSRSLSQTPWLIDDKKMASVERCIGLPLKLLCKGSSYKLISCGREDVNVRNLGVGRRVAIEVSNCKVDLFLLFLVINRLRDCKLAVSHNLNNYCLLTNSSSNDCANRKSGKAQVVNHFEDSKLLRDYFTPNFSLHNFIEDHNYFKEDNYNFKDSYKQDKDSYKQDKDNYKEDNNKIDNYKEDKDKYNYKEDNYKEKRLVVRFRRIKLAVNSRRIRREMQKKSERNRKRYNCLVFSENELNTEKVKLLQEELKFPLKIKQKNPIRISHRRAQDERPKEIFKMRLEVLSPRLMLVDVVTEAGVYVKEFVNGDLGRTRPSLSSVLGAGSLRLLFLDVLSCDFGEGCDASLEPI